MYIYQINELGFINENKHYGTVPAVGELVTSHYNETAPFFNYAFNKTDTGDFIIKEGATDITYSAHDVNIMLGNSIGKILALFIKATTESHPTFTKKGVFSTFKEVTPQQAIISQIIGFSTRVNIPISFYTDDSGTLDDKSVINEFTMLFSIFTTDTLILASNTSGSMDIKSNPIALTSLVRCALKLYLFDKYKATPRKLLSELPITTIPNVIGYRCDQDLPAPSWELNSSLNRLEQGLLHSIS